jgi:hypothetical protein
MGYRVRYYHETLFLAFNFFKQSFRFSYVIRNLTPPKERMNNAIEVKSKSVFRNFFMRQCAGRLSETGSEQNELFSDSDSDASANSSDYFLFDEDSMAVDGDAELDQEDWPLLGDEEETEQDEANPSVGGEHDNENNQQDPQTIMARLFDMRGADTRKVKHLCNRKGRRKGRSSNYPVRPRNGGVVGIAEQRRGKLLLKVGLI